jgi:hypothetical protein
MTGSYESEGPTDQFATSTSLYNGFDRGTPGARNDFSDNPGTAWILIE